MAKVLRFRTFLEKTFPKNFFYIRFLYFRIIVFYMFNKKGISSLVVSVLLILFVVTASGLVFNWIKKSADVSMEKGDVLSEKLQECRDFGFEIEGAYCIGDNLGVIKVIITNNKNYDLTEAFSVKLGGSEDSETSIASVQDIDLKAYETKEMNVFKQQGELGGFKTVESLEFVPKFFINEETVFCNDNKVIVEAENC